MAAMMDMLVEPCHMLNKIVCHVAQNFQNPISDIHCSFLLMVHCYMFTVTDGSLYCNTTNMWCCLTVICYKYLGIATVLLDFFHYLINPFGLDLIIWWSWIQAYMLMYVCEFSKFVQTKAVSRYSLKQVFSKISQCSWENNCVAVGVSVK